MNQCILVVVAHSDDEVISMGGTIRRHVLNGDKVVVISMTDGVSGRDGSTEKDKKKRLQAAERSGVGVGYQWGKCYDFADNAMDSYPLIEVIKSVEDAKKTYCPSMVYTHSGADLNIDHRVVANAVLTAFRPHPNENCQEIRLFEVASSTDYGVASLTGSFLPNLFVNISETWDAKLMGLNCYKDELRNFPHSRSIKAIRNLAEIRGSQAGFRMAEAFEVIRKLEF